MHQHGQPPVLRLARGQTHRCLTGHVWIFRSEFAELPEVEDGEEVEVLDHRGQLVGRGFYSLRSQIAVRLLCRGNQPLDLPFLRARLQRALAWREEAMPGREALRLIWSEADLLPGLIVDRYGSALVVQATTAGMDRRLEGLIGLLVDLLHPEQVVERNDLPVRDLEGLARVSRVVRGPPATRCQVRIGRLPIEIDLLDPHKTGSYLDQQLNHESMARWTRPGATVVDCFAHRGGFGLHALLAGAAQVHAIDTAAEPLAEGAASAARMQAPGTYAVERADAFAWLRTTPLRTCGVDLVVLDPPSFTQHRAGIPGALRGYRDLHLHALRLLRPGGRLVSFSCSHHIDEPAFLGTLTAAAASAHKCIRLEERLGPSPDHPVLPAIPETSYLKGVVVRVLEA